MNDVLGTIAQMSSGEALAELNREFLGVVDDVRAVGGTGEITVKLKISADGWDREGNCRQVKVMHSVASKRPRRKLGGSVFFFDNQGGLTRHNPDQLELQMAELDEKETNKNARR